MAEGLAGALTTAGLLVLVALPVSTLGGAALLVPWDRSRWTLAHWGRVLHRHGVVAAALVLMLVPEIIESQIDPTFTAMLPEWLREGPTRLLADLEGGFHEWLQSALPWQPLKLLFTAVYVAGYPFLIVVGIMLPLWMDKGRVARQAVAAYALSFAAALPFYLFLPVYEVWHYHDPNNMGAVRNVINEYPVVREHLYSFNDLNNCFPSLHTGISMVLALVLWRSSMPKRTRIAVMTLAWGIVFSTLYLGIHWVTDVVAGLLLAYVIAWLVRRLLPETKPEGPGLVRQGPDSLPG